jgi:hypothetical protein
MNPTVQRYVFDAGTDPDDVRAALLLALWGTESLHGETNVRLEAGYFFDPELLFCSIEENVPVGRDLNRLFLGFLIRELGADAFTTERATQDEERPLQPAMETA